MDNIDEAELPWRRPTEDDWNEKKELIMSMHEDHTFKQIRKACRFNATKKMFLTRFRHWGLQDKNHKEPEVAALLRKCRQREAIGKPSTGKIRGRTISMAEIERYARRKKLTYEELIDRAPSRTPPLIECRTPSPQPFDPPTFDMNVDRLFRIVGKYVHGSIESGVWRKKDVYTDYSGQFADAIWNADHYFSEKNHRKAAIVANHAFCVLPEALRRENIWLLANMLATGCCKNQGLRKIAINMITQLSITNNHKLCQVWQTLQLFNEEQFRSATREIYVILTEAFEAHEDYKWIAFRLKGEYSILGIWTYETAIAFYQLELDTRKRHQPENWEEFEILYGEIIHLQYLNGRDQDCEMTAASFFELPRQEEEDLEWLNRAIDIASQHARSRRRLGDFEGAIRAFRYALHLEHQRSRSISVHDMALQHDILTNLMSMLATVGRLSEAQVVQVEIDEVDALMEQEHQNELL